MTRRGHAGWFVLVCLLGASSVSFVPLAHADGMRCGSRLVSDGDSALEVRNVCGAPDQTSTRVEKRIVSRWIQTVCVDARGRSFQCGQMVQDTVDIVIDEWFYDFGPSALVRTVVFELGHLVRIVTGSYGTKDVSQ